MKRILSLILAAVMLFGMLPVQALAAEPIRLPDAEISEEVRQSGMFYLASNTASLEENESGKYALRIVRGGDAAQAATLRLEFVDVTANYGKDYKAALSGSGLFGAKVENADSSRSLMDQIAAEGVQEDLQQDLALAGMTEEQIESALQKQADGFSEVISTELSSYAEAHKDRYITPADDAAREELAGTAPKSETETRNEVTPVEDVPAEGASATVNAPKPETPAVTDVPELSAEPVAEAAASVPVEIPAALPEAVPELAAENADVAEPEDGVEATVRENPETVRLDDGEKQEKKSLSAAFEQQTGRKDDWKALSSDGSSVLNTTDLMLDYSMDAADVITEGLNSAYLNIPFAEGETERVVTIRTLDNNTGEGDRIFMARLTAQEETARVSGEFGRCMFTIVDDDPWEKPIVSFAQQSFDAENGFVNAVIRREGVLTAVSSVHLSTADGGAQNGRDYSQVDADVTFPFGVAERVIHIPVRSAWLYEQSSFRLTLSNPRSCTLGETAEAVGVIGKDSVSFEITKPEQKDPEAELQVYSGGIRRGDAIDLSKWSKTGVIYGSGSVWMDGNSCKIKADSNGLNDDRAWTYAEWNLRKDITRDGNIKAMKGYNACGIEYDGVAIKTSRNGDGRPQSRVYFWSAPDWYNNSHLQESNAKSMGSDETGSWDNQEYDFYWDEGTGRGKQGVSYVRIWNSKADGFWRKQNTLTIQEIRPILRPFVVTAEIANPDALRYVDNYGNLISYKDHDSVTSAGELTLGGANSSDNAVIKYVGDYVEITCEGRYSYIKKVQITNSSGNSYAVTPTYKVGNKTASFALDTSALRYLHNRNLITFTKNPDGSGYVGNLRLQVIMGKIPTDVKLENKDSRGEVRFGFGVHRGEAGSYARSGDDRDYNKVYRGDYVCFEESLKSQYADSFSASTIYIKRDRQSNSDEPGYSNDGFVKFDKNQSAWHVTMFNDYNTMLAKPAFDDIDNHIVVRVKDSDKALFHQTSGIFKASTIPGVDGYTDYEVVPQSGFTAHQFYKLVATPKDEKSVAIWTPGNSSVSYSQNSYFYEAAQEKGSNVITLTCQTADATPYAITGDAYYAALDLLTGVEGETWMPADGLTVMITPGAYGMSDDTGKFTTIPMKGVAGCRVSLRTEAMGTVNYKSVQLSKGVVKPVGTGEYAVNAYQVPLGTFVVPVVNPGATSVNAASLSDNTGATVKTAAIWPDAISAQQHRYTFTATVVHDGVTYADTDGVEHAEHVKSVEFVAYDSKDNTPRGELPGTVIETDNGNGSKTYSLTLGLDMTDDNLQIYRPGDKIYVRMTTDRIRGNGKSVNEEGEEVENPTLQETVYAPVYTGYNLVSAANFTPPELNINILDGNMDSLFEKLPIFGSLNSTLRLSKLAVSELPLPNGGISLCIGYRLNTDNDKKSKYYEDTTKFDGIKDAAKGMMKWGRWMKAPPPVIMGVGTAGINPFVGLYLDFALSDREESKGSLAFVGGGLYVGCTGFFKVVLYFPVGPIPVYFGVEGDLTAYVNLGFQVPGNLVTPADIAANGGVEDLMDLDFKFKAQAAMRVYVGVGLAGTLGVRGGLSFDMSYLYYPSVKNINPNYHEHGFTINLSLQVWVDAFWFSIPIPAKRLAGDSFGYFKDIENGGPKASLAAEEDCKPVMRRAVQPSGWLPKQPEAELQSTLVESTVTPLIGDNYPYADPQLLDTGTDLVVVFLTTDSLFGESAKGRGDETTLAYSVYPYTQNNPHWSAPRKLGNAETLLTGDFQPNITACADLETGANVQISWVSRKNEPWAADPEHPTTEERLEYLRQMEIYSAPCKVKDGELTMLDCQRVTNDNFYNYQPQATFEVVGTELKTMVFYQTSEPSVQDIAADDPVYTDFQNAESRQLLANVSPSQNAGFSMNKEFDTVSGNWKADELGAFIVTPVGGQNHPAISDFTVQEYLSVDDTATDIHYWIVFAYTVDGDGNMSTPYDSKLYIQLYNAETETFCEPICVSDTPGVAVSRPQFTETRRYDCYLLWYEAADTTREEFANWKKNGEVKVLSIRDLFRSGIDAETGTLKESVRIDALRANHGAEYEALEDKTGLTDYAYTIPVHTVNIADSEEFEDGPSVGSFMPYLDNSNNLFVIWLQNMTNEVLLSDGTTEHVQTNEIYAAARIEDDSVPEEANVWSMPVRLTNDVMFYDEATLVNLQDGNKLVVAANRYAFAIQPEGTAEAKPVESADFVAVEFEAAGSMEAVSLRCEPEMPEAGETVEMVMTVRNTGLLTAPGGSYTIRDQLDEADGDFTLSGTVGKLLPGETEEVRFSYTLPADLETLSSITFLTEVKETGFADTDHGRFKNAIPVGWRAELGAVSAEERSDGFYLSYELMNSGNTPMPAGAAQVMAGESGAMDVVWAKQPIDETLGVGESITQTVKLENVADNFETGFQRGFVMVADAEGKQLESFGSTRDIVLTLTSPYNVVVNEQPELQTVGINVAAGGEIDLNGSYEGVSRFPDGEVQFTTLDNNVATVCEDVLYANEPGETVLVAKVGKYGGTVTIPVTVMANVVSGDINGDGSVNAKDVTALRRYLAGGYGVTLTDAVADVNCDGEVNAKDVTILRRALAGGYGVTLR